MLRTISNNFTTHTRYLFQAQEMDDEIKGEGNSVNYKYRMHDPRLGRFFSVDPLAAKYPHNSPYAFSENRVLDALELEGAEAYYIHGTVKSSAGDFTGKVNSMNMSKSDLSDISKVFDNKTINRGFNWSGLNNDNSRHDAAKSLALYILATRTNDEPISLIGHSHGGNVAIEAANILIENHGLKADQINIVALNTPREYDIELKDTKVDLFAVSAKDDQVQFWGSDATWNDFGDQNVQKNDKLIYYNDQVTQSYDEKFGIQQNHSGWVSTNVKKWLPKLAEAVKNLNSSKKTEEKANKKQK
jgi:RHS repeat-associated protein